MSNESIKFNTSAEEFAQQAARWWAESGNAEASARYFIEEARKAMRRGDFVYVEYCKKQAKVWSDEAKRYRRLARKYESKFRKSYH